MYVVVLRLSMGKRCCRSPRPMLHNPNLIARGVADGCQQAGAIGFGWLDDFAAACANGFQRRVNVLGIDPQERAGVGGWTPVVCTIARIRPGDSKLGYGRSIRQPKIFS